MSIVDDIKDKLDIVEVISQYLPLQKAGRNFKALCPFHTEKTPSFYVFPERGGWHCFGCAAGGDLFTFVMQMERLEFKDALRTLAERAGIPLASQPTHSAAQEETQRLRELNHAAAAYYHNILVSTPVAAGARDYLANRGISPQTIIDFQLGFSPPSWDSLRGYLLEKGYAETDVSRAGLLVERDEGPAYDRFRNRLMIPIKDPQGRVAGFGARALDDSLPKYINSPQTAIFDKGSLLYGLDQARNAIRQEDSAVIVEGYMDVLAAHQHGFKNVVASMGTSLTEKQIAAIKSITKNIILALDADAAGDMAAVRGVEIARQTMDERVIPVPTGRGLVKYRNVLDGEIRVMTLPRGKDPDEVIRESPDLWRRLVGEALPVIDFLLQATASRLDIDSSQGKSAAVEAMLPAIMDLKDPVEQAHYLQRLARVVRIDERLLLSRLGIGAPPKRGKTAPRAAEERPASPGEQREVLEEYCLALLLQQPELREQAQELTPQHFTEVRNRELYKAFRDSGCGEDLRAQLDPTLQSHWELLARMLLPPEPPAGWPLALAQVIRRLEERRLRALKLQEGYLIEEAESEAGAVVLAERSFAQWKQGEATDNAGEISAMDRIQVAGLELNIRLRELFARAQQRNETHQGPEGGDEE